MWTVSKTRDYTQNADLCEDSLYTYVGGDNHVAMTICDVPHCSTCPVSWIAYRCSFTRTYCDVK